jgi:enoyl-[acyl-carrier protein] reductase II
MRAAPVTTRITKLLSCDYPVILPGMSWISTVELVAAVSNAGGIGILATGPLSASVVRQSIRDIRDRTDRPFGIGATLVMPGATENAEVAIEEQVPIINVSLGKPDALVPRVHAYGGKVISTVTSVKFARAALDAGADGLLVTGYEAAAHGSDVTSLVLINRMRHQFADVPMIAAGGFANGRSLAAALALGADAVALGSRFATTVESPLPPNVQDHIVQSSEHDTIYGSNFDGIPARVLKTPTAMALMQSRPWFPIVCYRALRAARTMRIPLWQVLPGLLTQFSKMYTIAQFGAATDRLTAATIDGDLEQGVQFIGQSQGLINDIATVEEIMQRIVVEAREASTKTLECF